MPTLFHLALAALCILSQAEASGKLQHAPLLARQHVGGITKHLASLRSQSTRLADKQFTDTTKLATSQEALSSETTKPALSVPKPKIETSSTSSTISSGSSSIPYSYLETTSSIQHESSTASLTTENKSISSHSTPHSASSPLLSQSLSAAEEAPATLVHSAPESVSQVISASHSHIESLSNLASPSHVESASKPSLTVSQLSAASHITPAPSVSKVIHASEAKISHLGSISRPDLSQFVVASQVIYHTQSNSAVEFLHDQQADALSIEFRLLPDSQATPSQSAASTCPSGQVKDRNSCIDIQTDTKNCGQVGWDCYSPDNNINNLLTPNIVSWTCAAGICQLGCVGSTSVLDTAAQMCIDTTNDSGNCGSLGYVCSANSQSDPSVSDFQCVNSKCEVTCQGANAGYDENGNCVDYNTNSQNCGGKGLTCMFDASGQQTGALDGILYPCYQATCQTCHSGATGNWSAQTLSCQQETLGTGANTVNDACTTIGSTALMVSVDVWSNCGVLNWFTAYINQNPTLRDSPQFASQFAADLGLAIFDCDYSAQCGYKQPTMYYSDPTSTSAQTKGPKTDAPSSDAADQIEYYYTDQFNGFLILLCLSNFNDMLFASIQQSNDALTKAGDTISTMLTAFQQQPIPAQSGQSPGQIISEVLGIAAGVLMLANPAMVPLAMTVMLGTQVYNLFASNDASSSSAAPTTEMVLSASSYSSLLATTVSQIQSAWKTSSTNVLNDYTSALGLISDAGNVATLINYTGIDRTDALINYLLSFMASKCFQDESVFFSSQAFDSAGDCSNALSTMAVASGPDAFCDSNNRLFYLNYWSYNVPATTVQTCSGTSVYSSSTVSVALTTAQDASLTYTDAYQFGVPDLARQAYQCQYGASPWNGWPFVASTSQLPVSFGYTGSEVNDPCLVNTPICDLSDQNLVNNCNAAGWAGYGLDCTTLEGLSLYCANQLGLTSGISNFCGTLWPQGPKFCQSLYNDIQSGSDSQNCGSDFGGGGFIKRSSASQNRLSKNKQKRGCYLSLQQNTGQANCGYLNCGGDLVDYADLLSDTAYSCDTSFTAPSVPTPTSSVAPSIQLAGTGAPNVIPSADLLGTVTAGAIPTMDLTNLKRHVGQQQRKRKAGFYL